MSVDLEVAVTEETFITADNTAPVAVYSVADGTYVIQTGNQVTMIRFT